MIPGEVPVRSNGLFDPGSRLTVPKPTRDPKTSDLFPTDYDSMATILANGFKVADSIPTPTTNPGAR